ncbi:MAG: DMT family transporter [Coriobacteriia bacterium]|nr:DMT family transporter [Coriobacteriia bacterium]
MTLRGSKSGAAAALIGVAAVWGATFVIVADAIAVYPMYAFLGWRFALATVTFAIIFPRSIKRLDGANLRMGLFAGAFLTAGYIFQTWGLDGETATTPARAAFITGLYVVIVPLAQAVFLRRMPRPATLMGAGLALAGLWLLSGVDASGLGGWVFGDSMIVVCAVAYSAHMLVLGSTDERHDTGALTLVQLVTVTVVTASISLLTEDAGLPTEPSVLFAIAVCGILASALAFAIQTWAQRRMPPARVALILVTEPAFGGVIGWAAAGVWPLMEVAGASLMLGGMITSEVVAAAAPESEMVEFEAGVQGMAAPVVEDEHRPSRLFDDSDDEPGSGQASAHQSAIDPKRGAL